MLFIFSELKQEILFGSVANIRFLINQIVYICQGTMKIQTVFCLGLHFAKVQNVSCG